MPHPVSASILAKTSPAIIAALQNALAHLDDRALNRPLCRYQAYVNTGIAAAEYAPLDKAAFSAECLRRTACLFGAHQ